MNWEDLLKDLENGLIVPVIGNDLSLVYTEHNGVTTLHKCIARKLSSELNIHSIDVNLAEMILSFRKQENYPDIIQAIKKIYLSIPDEQFSLTLLNKLADIREFDFFISATFDDLLVRALCKTRDLERNQVQIINYSLTSSHSSGPVVVQAPVTVFNILGNLDHYLTGQYVPPALNEEELLEYFLSFTTHLKHSLVEELRQRLAGKRLLFIGCDFTDWFMRFIVRIISGERYEERTIKDIIVCDGIKGREKLYYFLKQYKEDLYPPLDDCKGNVQVFIDDLLEKVKGGEKKPLLFSGTVFLSYNHLNLQAARTLKRALRNEGVDVWLDETHLNAGKFTPLIKKKIKECMVFIPLISDIILSDPGCYARREEWVSIGERIIADTYYNNKEPTFLLLPVIVDQTIFKDERIPAFIRPYTIRDFPKDQEKIIQDILDFLTPIYSLKEGESHE